MNIKALICGITLVLAIVLIVISAAQVNPAYMLASVTMAMISAFFALRYSRENQ